jgi:hypothetical protein
MIHVILLKCTIINQQRYADRGGGFPDMLLAGKRKPSMNAIHAKEDL